LKAVIFDLYGTLVDVRERLVHKQLPRALGASGRDWVALVREHLLVTPFADNAGFARFVVERLAPAAGAAGEAAVLELVEREVNSVETTQGARSLLAFLKRRGFALGLLSNLASPHKAPVERLGLAEHLAAMGFSCDAAVTKPEPRFYLDLCARLGAAPEDTLMVGDSARNDVEAPRQLGMRAVLVADAAPAGALRRVAELGFRALAGEEPLQPLLADGDAVALRGAPGILRDLQMLPDDQQGRYNLVASGRVVFDGGGTEDVFCKRFLFPEAAHVEEFAHQIQTAVGVPSCAAFVSSGPEPCLIVTRAPGRKLEATVTPDLAHEIGRHCAMAYLFANADLRPRNAFVSFAGSRPEVTVVDLEHCFFNMALDVTGLEDPLRPESFDRLTEEQIEQRVLRRVLSERTTRRTRRTFFETESLDTSLASAFKEGWLAVYRSVKGNVDGITSLIEERVGRPPYLVIGTQSHRRAMARADVRDIRRRIEQDPEVVFKACF
jgi:HAD superfamily hydrolase (TIGR01509 family)